MGAAANQREQLRALVLHGGAPVADLRDLAGDPAVEHDGSRGPTAGQRAWPPQGLDLRQSWAGGEGDLGRLVVGG